MNILNNARTVGLSCLLVVGLTAGAHAQGTGMKTTHITEDGTTYYVGGPNDPVNGIDPIPVALIPGNDPWTKMLMAPTNGWQKGVTYSLHEEVKMMPVVPNLAWRDWHEHFLPELPNPSPAVWLSGGISTDWPVGPNPPAPVSGLMVMGIGTPDIWFKFDPILPTPLMPNPTVLHIWKDFQWDGTDSAAAVLIEEYPTPEPSTLVLGLLGMLGVGACRPRRRKRGSIL